MADTSSSPPQPNLAPGLGAKPDDVSHFPIPPLGRWYRPSRLMRMLFPLRLSQWLGPFLLAGGGALLLAIVVITSGSVNLAASEPHPQGWAQLLHFTFNRATAHQSANLVAPPEFGSPAQIAKGATYYGTACAHCHGAPGLGQNPVALSMRPRPQYLVREVANLSDRQLFWIVKHGVAYSGMPSYPVQDRDDEIWSIVSFLRVMPQLSTARYRQLAYGDALATAGKVDPIPALANDVAGRAYMLPNRDVPEGGAYAYAYPSLGFDSFSINGAVVQTCARCHIDNGTAAANGAIPNIAILGQNYFRTALQKYAAGTRHSGFMQPVATQLDEQQIAALAAYYTAQPRRATDTGASASDLALGEQLATVGDAKRGLGACAGCHDVSRAANKAYPAIDGQHSAYLAGRLRQFRVAPPTGGGGNPMIAIARHMDDRAIKAVAAFYAQRAPSAPSPILVAEQR